MMAMIEVINICLFALCRVFKSVRRIHRINMRVKGHRILRVYFTVICPSLLFIIIFYYASTIIPSTTNQLIQNNIICTAQEWDMIVYHNTLSLVKNYEINTTFGQHDNRVVGCINFNDVNDVDEGI